MRYSWDNGVEGEGGSRKLLVSIPVIVALLLLIGLAGKHNHLPAPLTTGKPHPIAVRTLSVNTSTETNTPSEPTGGVGGAELAIASTGTAIAGGSGGLQGGSSATLGGSGGGGSTTVTGGRGGGSGGGPTVTSCIDALTQAQQVCFFPYQACTPPAGITAVGKPVLTTSGTCIIIN
jgi:hypothetical protein